MGDGKGEWEMRRIADSYIHNPDVGSMQAPSDSAFFSPSPAPSLPPSLPELMMND